MIQAIMLIALGFLIASLIGVLLAPSLWSRASRLSKKRLEAALPLTLGEIEATQDQLRATYAVRVRRLESSLAGAKQKAANQLVDNSRLQMQIVALKDQIADLDLKLSERRNAATVLEQTITKRFPELDREITAVKAQLQERSYELQDLTSKLGRREEELAATQEAAAVEDGFAAPPNGIWRITAPSMTASISSSPSCVSSSRRFRIAILSRLALSRANCRSLPN